MVQGPGGPTNMPPLNRPEGPGRIPAVQPPMNRPPAAAPARGREGMPGMQATNGTDSVRVSQQALRASTNGGPESTTPPNAATVRTAAVVGEPPPPPPLSPERPPPPEEEEMNIGARQQQQPPAEPPRPQIPEMMQEFGPGQAGGQKINLMA